MKNTKSVAGMKSDGSVRLQYPDIIRPAIAQAIGSWKGFCSLPESIRARFPYDPNGGMGVGYELKKTPGSFLDLKEDFHYSTGKRESLAESAASVGEPIASRLVSDANRLLDLLAPFVIEFALELERQFGLDGLAREVADSQGMWFLRFIHYFGGRREDDEIATSHADKCGFTLHLMESDPGLQFLDFQNKWNDVPVSTGETVIIPGMRLQYRSKNELKALYHRVVATPETAEAGRFSMVLFVHLCRTPEYDKKRAGRLQEFPPGFNYEMPFEEFSKLFK